MNTYLAIITTVLVLTQIIRVLQNYTQLKRHDKVDKRNDEIMDIYRKISRYIDHCASGLYESEDE